MKLEEQGCGLESTGSEYSPLSRYCDNSNDGSGCMKDNYQLLEENDVQWQLNRGSF